MGFGCKDKCLWVGGLVCEFGRVIKVFVDFGMWFLVEREFEVFGLG